MTPAGYLLKRIPSPPGWLSGAPIGDVCSVAGCVNRNVVDVQTAWRHNAFGVANDQATLTHMAVSEGGEVADAKLFYYEVYEQEIETDGWEFDPEGWRPLTAVSSAGVETSVLPPGPSLASTLIGYDVVVFGDYLEHSPLSCNGVATAFPVNEHCLFDTLQDAKAAIDDGAFGGGCEEGVYRIFSVSIVSAAKET